MTDHPRPRRPLAPWVAVAAWVGAAVLAGGVAWGAVSTFDAGPRSGPLGASEVRTALATAQAAAQQRSTASPSPASALPSGPATPGTEATPTVDPEPSVQTTRPPSAPVQPPAEVSRTWAVTGGTVAATCTGRTITLAYATPDDGWTLEVASSGPERVEVELDKEGAETKIGATCIDGVPVPDVAQDRKDEQD